VALFSLRTMTPSPFAATLVVSTFLMGSSFIASKYLLRDGYPSTLLVGWRFIAAALAALPLVLLDGGRFRDALLPSGTTRRHVALVVLIGVIQTTGVMGLLFLSLRSIPASTAAIILSSNPIWVALLGRVFMGEQLPYLRVLGLVVGLAGVACAIGIGPDLFANPVALAGEGVALASALCWAVSTMLAKHAVLPLGPWAMSFWQMLVGACVLLVIGYCVGEQWPSHTNAAQWGMFLWLAIPASTGSFGLWFLALRQGGATRASSYLFLPPLFAIILSFFLLDAPITWMQLAGGGLVGLAIWLIGRSGPQRETPAVRAQVLAEGEP